MDAFAVVSSKFASSIPSPASASANLVASAPHLWRACLRVRKFPVLFDIFFPLSMRCPFARIAKGQCFSGKIAVWLYRQNVRWLGIKSLPDDRISIGYQYEKECLSAWRDFSGMLVDFGTGPEARTYSQTSSVICSGVNPKGPGFNPSLSAVIVFSLSQFAMRMNVLPCNR
jgi:hypothetical protein